MQLFDEWTLDKMLFCSNFTQNKPRRKFLRYVLGVSEDTIVSLVVSSFAAGDVFVGDNAVGSDDVISGWADGVMSSVYVDVGVGMTYNQRKGKTQY